MSPLTIITIGGLFWVFSDMLHKPSLARINNNPLNIRYNRRNNWNGQVGEGASGFVKFESPAYGFRAGAILLKNYRKKYGIDTISSILDRFAPPHENKNLTRYKTFVAKQLGIPVSGTVNEGDYPVMLRAMAKFESGEYWPQPEINAGISMS